MSADENVIVKRRVAGWVARLTPSGALTEERAEKWEARAEQYLKLARELDQETVRSPV